MIEDTAMILDAMCASKSLSTKCLLPLITI